MKSILRMLLPLLLVGCTHYMRNPDKAEVRLIVTHVLKQESGYTEVWAKHSYMTYMAQFQKVPDSIKRGIIITVKPYDKNVIRDTTCMHIFKRIK